MLLSAPRLAAAVTALVLLSPAAAAAKAPPKGNYGCTIGGTYFGTVKITSASKYKRNGKKGKFKAGATQKTWPDKNVPGYTINFKTGGFKGFKGRWYRSDGGVVEIALRNPVDNFESIYCDKE
jgi:hypothetical protein